MNTTEGKYNLSPRKYWDVSIGSDYGNLRETYDDIYMKDYQRYFVKTSDSKHTLQPYDWMYSDQIKYNFVGGLELIDTLQERDIKLGTKYEFDPMTEGECYMNKEMTDDMNLAEGDLLYQKIEIFQNLIALIDIYNN